MARRVCVALVLGLSIAACSGAATGTTTARATARPGVTASPFAALSGLPLKLSPAGGSCPMSKMSQLGPHLGEALGSGPIYVFSGQVIGSGPYNKAGWGRGP